MKIPQQQAATQPGRKLAYNLKKPKATRANRCYPAQQIRFRTRRSSWISAIFLKVPASMACSRSYLSGRPWWQFGFTNQLRIPEFSNKRGRRTFHVEHLGQPADRRPLAPGKRTLFSREPSWPQKLAILHLTPGLGA